MNTLTTTDNITELLDKIIDFTERRHKILTRNIVDMHSVEFVPEDLDVTGFAGTMTQAVSEHIQSRRLLLCDNENIKFGIAGDFESLAIVDTEAESLLNTEKTKYLEHEIRKLSENMLNNKVACELLEQQQKQTSVLKN